MTQLYRFSVEVKEVKGISRVIDIARDAKLADLAYVILSAFQTFAYHLWEIRYQGKHYDCMVCVEDFF
jgi:hypothetical protein